MRFTEVLLRNTDPSIPSGVVAYPMALDEPDVWSMEDDIAHFEGWCPGWFDGELP